MISSKAAEIYKQAQVITQMKKENPEASEAKSESSLKDSDQEEEEEQEEDPRLSQMSDY